MNLPKIQLSISPSVVVGICLSQAAVILYLIRRVISVSKEINTKQEELLKEKNLRKDERVGRINSQKRSRNEFKEKALYQFRPIGFIESPFPSRCGTPRQPNLVTAARGFIRFDKKVIQLEHFKELEEFSHIWVVWVFHENTNLDLTSIPAKIAPPRLGGKRVGCLSTRSPHRPNPIGLSVLQVHRVTSQGIEVMGVDMVQGTPVLDVKPYVHYDSIPLDLHSLQPHFSRGSGLISGETSSSNQPTILREPNWVKADDVPLRVVKLVDAAWEGLRDLIYRERLRFCVDEDEALRLITQVLQLDIRSVHQGRGGGGSSVTYRCQLDGMIVSFITHVDAVEVIDLCAIEVDASAADVFKN